MRLRGNPFGLPEALVGIAVGFVLASVSVSVFGSLTHHPRHPGTFGASLVSLLGLWSGMVGATLYASAARRRGAAAAGTPAARRAGPAEWMRWLRDDYGLALRPWPDVPLGIAVGLGSQYGLVPLLELPLLPFVPHLFHRLGEPADQLTSGTDAASLAVLAVFICVGSPLVEELFFRGLLLRAIAGRLVALPEGGRAAVSIAVVSMLFGLAHFEALQLVGLVGFGVVLGVLAWTTGRLGPGIVAHATFNAVTVVTIALRR